MQVIKDEAVDQLEHFPEKLNSKWPPLQEFILPGGNLPAAHCHHARTVCRRAERRLTHLSRQEGEQVSANALKYLNRLSDLLFVIGRVVARENGGSEVLWRKGG